MLQKKITVFHFIDSLGSGKFACDKIKKENNIDFIHSDFYSHKEFKSRNDLLVHNKIGKLVLVDKWNIPGKYNIQISIPPCKGLSTLGMDMRTKKSTLRWDHESNNWIYYTVEVFLKMNNDVLIFENGINLSKEVGKKILNNIVKMLPSKYKMTVVKTNMIKFGIPHVRKRTFVIIYKSQNYFKLHLQSFYKKYLPLDEFFKKEKVINKKYPYYYQKETYQEFLDNPKIFSQFKFNQKTIIGELANLYKEGKFKKQISNNRIFHYVNRFIKEDGRVFQARFLRFHKRDYVNTLAGWKGIGTFLLNKKRYINMGELLSLMGLPQSFEIIRKDSRIIFRTCPSHFLKPFIQIAISILNKDGKLYEKVNIEKKEKYFLQDELK